MESFYVKDLIKAVNGKFLLGDPNLQVKSVSIDSRTVKKGQFFFAIKGKNFDGHDFIKDAVEREVSGIVYSEDDADFANPFPKFPSIVKVSDTEEALGNLAKAYRRRFDDVKVVGITGSNGKTTTKEMLTSILKRKGKTINNKGNFNNRIGLPMSVLDMRSEHKYAVFEMGTSLHGEIKILSDILRPDVGIITNIGFSHLETFNSPEGVFKEKRALLDNVADDGFIVVNNDDDFLKRISHQHYSKKMITFALYGGADIYAKNISLWADKPSFELHTANGSVNIEMPVKGRFNVMNALAAAAAAFGLGLGLEEIKYGIENFTPPAMRMETAVLASGAILINDAYNANPSSVRESVQAVCESYGDGEINLVLGDMLELGEKASDYHFSLGEFLNSQRVKSIYLIGDMSLYTKEGLTKKTAYHAKDEDVLFKMLQRAPVNNKSVFLFKASRGMHLEEIYSKFRGFLDKGKK
ncbi:MAG: UDP-N-acetylmuramoyl-tripeptide--D-alanyl-D-alanine ligase [Endomicrobia bacterium]|nr:UDP-N-acetylmuramoyl-tripeptide--D-alanyl-D-alanine ligase [Endomicrobiia bacterium]